MTGDSINSKWRLRSSLSYRKISVPRTAFTEKNIDNIPKKALDAIKSNIMALYPDLAEFGLTGTRVSSWNMVDLTMADIRLDVLVHRLH